MVHDIEDLGQADPPYRLSDRATLVGPPERHVVEVERNRFTRVLLAEPGNGSVGS